MKEQKYYNYFNVIVSTIVCGRNNEAEKNYDFGALLYVDDLRIYK